MRSFIRFGFLALIFVVSPSQVLGQDDEFLYDVFPEDFRWGFATASYQIEGGYDADGKGPSIWDNFTHRDPSPVFDGSSGDVACDSYHLYESDVELLKNIGADYYRFSLSWSRILPTGRISQVNQLGIDYYNRLIDLLIENNIEPLYHWDLPDRLQDIGGWPNEEIVNHFQEYADLAFKSFGDRVKKWITFNEPVITCIYGYATGAFAPGIVDINQPYLCANNIIKSHAKAYRLYERFYKETQNGTVGITLDTSWFEPADPNNQSHVEASERALQFYHGWFASPIFFGKYPDVMRQYVDSSSNEEGVPSRLPEFTQADSDEIKGSWDFLGLNYYTTELAEPTLDSNPGWFGDQDIKFSHDPEWPSTSASWLKVVPWGFRKILNWLKNTYDNPLIYVTENGYADYPDTGLNDMGRVNYYTSYINEMLKASKLDGVNVKSYTAWSLMDNFEWDRGYSERFGIHSVNFSDPARPRTPKASAAVIKKIYADNGFPQP